MNIIPILAELTTDQTVNGPSVDRTISIWQMLIPIVVPALIAILRAYIPTIPKKYVPFIAPLLGAIIDILLNFAHLGGGVGAVGAVLGTAGIGVRELSRIRKKELVIPSVTLTNGPGTITSGFGGYSGQPIPPKPPYNGPGSPSNP